MELCGTQSAVSHETGSIWLVQSCASCVLSVSEASQNPSRKTHPFEMCLPCVIGTPCSWPLLIRLALLMPFYKANGHSLWLSWSQRKLPFPPTPDGPEGPAHQADDFSSSLLASRSWGARLTTPLLTGLEGPRHPANLVVMTPSQNREA